MEKHSKFIFAEDKNDKPMRFDFYFGDTGLIDVFDENAQDWFWGKYVNIFDQDVAGTWISTGVTQ